MKSLVHEILSFYKSVLHIYLIKTKIQPLHVIMVHQSIKEHVLLLWLEGATFHWVASGYKFNIMNFTLLPYSPLACFCTTPFGTCSMLYITLHFVYSGLCFCLCLLAIHNTFSSLQCSALQYSFYSDYVFSSFSFTHFVSYLCQQPFGFLFQTF